MTLHSSALGKAPIPAGQQPHHYHRSWKPLAPWEYGGEVWDWEELVPSPPPPSPRIRSWGAHSDSKSDVELSLEQLHLQLLE